MNELVAVRFRDCACPGTPHDGKDGRDDGDLAYLPTTAPLEVGLATDFDYQQVIAKLAGRPDDTGRLSQMLYVRWTRSFVEHGVVRWNLVDDKGQPVPLDTSVLVADYALAKPIADKAHELGYAQGVMRPLILASSESSASGPTEDSTSSEPIPLSPESRSGRRSAGPPSRARTG